jgi:ABC-2 type transport system permease protein
VTRAIALMIGKDLRRKVRAPLGLLVLLLFPLAFAGILALTFGGGQVPRVHLLVENRDEGLLGNALLSALDSNRVAEYFDVEIVDAGGLALIERGKGSALLRIPESFTIDVLEGKPTALELVRNPAQGIMPEVAEQVAGVLAEILSAGSRVLREPLDTIAALADEDAADMSDEVVAAVSVAIKGSVEGAEKFLFPVVIDLETVSLGAPPPEAAENGDEEDGAPAAAFFSIFLFVLPGISVWSLFMIGDIAMRDVITENVAGTLRRQLQGPITTAALIVAKAGFTAVVSLACLVILAVTGLFALDRPVSPVGFVLLSLALILAVTGAGATVYGAAGRAGRGATIASVVYLVLGFSGGSFIQVEALPGPVRAIAPISPFYWGTKGYTSLIQDGAGVADVLVPVIVLAGLGAVFLAIGASLLKRRIARGSAT